MTKINRPMLFILTWTIIGIVYLPFFIASWLLHIIARFLLSISYFGMLNAAKGKDVFSSIFRFNPNIYA